MTDRDLDNLETLEREATPGPWHVERVFGGRDDAPFTVVAENGSARAQYLETVEDAAFIVAMRNALPALIADSRTLAAYRTREQQARALAAEWRKPDWGPGDPKHPSYAVAQCSDADALEAIYAKEAANGAS